MGDKYSGHSSYLASKSLSLSACFLPYQRADIHIVGSERPIAQSLGMVSC